ncbi:venom carboxylesterase-6-like [Copidosoma floridanum]|uniref:venom carboxylesterase-6-like n=1 Tax=Copidosoma floridanum TaxID=29053 RepID=UPI0006C9A2D4|nr:venom carboxylesterase-6-like [Copidosoma floridanum]
MLGRIVLLLLFGFESATFSAAARPFVQTHLGGIVGYHKVSFGGRRYEAYEGIPYALPPIGERRFQPPELVRKWMGNLTATKSPSPCIQYHHEHLNYRVLGTEDCLYLSVYVPTEINGSHPLPVIFTIHGGAFQFGSALAGARFLMDRDVIVVGINYRLGPFGFLSTEDDGVVPGNMGLKDQSAALRWTSENIRHFGGDPERITLIGYSAGGASVHFHYLSPMSRGLFRNGLSFSGTGFGPGKHCENSRDKARKLAAALGCPTESTREAIECLRYRPSRTISEATKNFMPWLYNPFTPFGPVIEAVGDEPFMNRSAAEIIDSGDVADLLWITGVVSEDGLYPIAEFINDEDLLADLDKNWETIAPHLLDFNYTVPLDEHASVARSIRSHYFGTKPIDKRTTKELIAMTGDRLYAVDGEKAAKAQAKVNKSSVLFWYYSYRALTSASDLLSDTMDNYGVSHSDDIGMVFENNFMYPPMNARDRAMQIKLIDLVVSVAEKGYPDLNLDFEWERVDPSKEELDYLHIAGPEVIKMESKANMGQKHFWSTIDFDENKL